MSKLVLLVGPPGSGKSTLAKKYESEGFVRISQDDQGKGGHQDLFMECVREGKDIVVDRMNFNKQQRGNYLYNEKWGYDTEIVVLHENYDTCLARALARENHPTIKDEKSARAALSMFFSKYERPEPGEANKITFLYPPGDKPTAIICDLDGTLCDIEHRRHHLSREEGKKPNWRAFFSEMQHDAPNQWCVEILARMSMAHKIVFCSGRPDDYREVTAEWIALLNVKAFVRDGLNLFMRQRNDSRQDSIIKEILLDFEILTRYAPYFMIDDRQQVVDMWRKRGYTCLQCASGDF